MLEITRNPRWRKYFDKWAIKKFYCFWWPFTNISLFVIFQLHRWILENCFGLTKNGCKPIQICKSENARIFLFVGSYFAESRLFQQHTWWFESRNWDAICGKLCDFVFNMGFGKNKGRYVEKYFTMCEFTKNGSHLKNILWNQLSLFVHQ